VAKFSPYVLPIAVALALGCALINEAVFRVTTSRNVQLYLVPTDDYTIRESCIETKYFFRGIVLHYPVDLRARVLSRSACGSVNARQVIDGDRLEVFDCQNRGEVWKCSQPFGQYIRVPDFVSEAVKIAL
jgi:hypothetical protein